MCIIRNVLSCVGTVCSGVCEKIVFIIFFFKLHVNTPYGGGGQGLKNVEEKCGGPLQCAHHRYSTSTEAEWYIIL